MGRGRPFDGSMPGPGRKKGVPNKATVEIKAVARALIEDPDYVAALPQRLREGKAPHIETLLYQYAYGKPVERHEVGDPGAFLSDAELQARLRELAAKAVD